MYSQMVAQEVGPATNLSASVPVTIFLKDINDNPPIFGAPLYEVTLSENASAGTRVVQVSASDCFIIHIGVMDSSKQSISCKIFMKHIFADALHPRFITYFIYYYCL